MLTVLTLPAGDPVRRFRERKVDEYLQIRPFCIPRNATLRFMFSVTVPEVEILMVKYFVSDWELPI